MKINRSRSLIAALSLSAWAWAHPASAAVTINLVETGDNVVATFSGTLNFGSLFPTGPGSASGSFINPSLSAFTLGAIPESTGNATTYVGSITAPASFGTGEAASASTSSGDYLRVSSVLHFSTDRLNAGFSNGDAVSGSSTWLNHSFASLGLTEGSYTWTWSGDSIVMNVSAVPEPSAYAAILGGLILGGVMTRRRRRALRTISA